MLDGLLSGGFSRWQGLGIARTAQTCVRHQILYQILSYGLGLLGQIQLTCPVSNDCQDYSVATSEAPASLVPAPTRSTTPSSAAASASAESTSQDGDAGLSAGAKAGIGIGIALLVLGIIGVVAFIFLRRRRTAGAQTLPDGDVKELHGSTTRPTEMPLWQDEKKDATMTNVKDQPQPYTYPVEAPGDAHWPGQMHEMDANSVRTHEMSSDTEVNANTNTNNSTRRS